MSIDQSMLDPAGVDESQILEVEAEDEPGFVQFGHWVLFNYHLSPTARCLYGELAAFVNRVRRRAGDTNVWPTLPMLAISIGVGTGDQVTPYLDELVQVGAIVRRSTYDSKGRRTRNRYGVRFNPPIGHTNDLSVIMAHLKPLSEDKEAVSAEAKRTKAIIQAQRKQAKNQRAAGLSDPPSLTPSPYRIGVPGGNGKTAGQGVPEKTRGRTPKNSGTYPKKLGSNNTNTTTTGRGGQEDAHARANSPTDSTNTPSAPSAAEPSRAAESMVRGIADGLGESLSPREHQRLADAFDAALEVVTDMAAQGADLHPTHLAEYLGARLVDADGEPTYDDLYAVLKYRLGEDVVRAKLPAFVASPGFSRPCSDRWGTGRHQPADPGVREPSTRSPHPKEPATVRVRRCSRHRIPMERDPSGWGLACPMCEQEPPAPRPAPKPQVEKLLEALPEPADDNPYGEHCGNNLCNREQRTIVKRVGGRVWAAPCPVCRPGERGTA